MGQVADEELIIRCASGDRGAMDMLVSRHYGKLLDFALRHLRDREASADVAQVTLLKVFQSADSFRGQSSFRTWLYAIALNVVRDHARSRKRKDESLLSDFTDGDVENFGPAEDAALDQIDCITLWQSVEDLPEQHRTAVILRFRVELTYEEIADVTGVSSGTAKSWIHYALKALRKSVKSEEWICAAKSTNRT